MVVPALYVDSHQHADANVRLGRATEWQLIEEQLVAGVGRRVFLLDDKEVSLLELRDLQFKTARGVAGCRDVIADLEPLVAPVDPAAPAGLDLRYQPIFDEIKAARREAEVDPRELTPWKRVADLVVSAMARSRDLQLVAWLTEALVRIDGFQGAASGLAVTRRTLDQYLGCGVFRGSIRRTAIHSSIGARCSNGSTIASPTSSRSRR